MTRLPRPCLGARDPATGRQEACGTPTTGSRCLVHEPMHQASRRPSPVDRGYDAEYRRERAELLGPDADGRPPACALRLEGCTYWADTADHVVPRVGGRRVPEAEGGRRLVPACAHCNAVKGGRTVDLLARPRPAADGPRRDEPRRGEAWHPDP